MPLSLALSPEGHLVADDLAEDSSCFTRAHEPIARERLSEGSAAVMLWLASLKSSAALPLAAVYWREMAGHWLSRFCHRGGVAPEPFTNEEGEKLIEQVAPMRGAEHLTVDVLRSLWSGFGAEVLRRIESDPRGADAWLREHLPHWHLVGRVTLHLAENKKDIECPFAFLATYTSGLTHEGKPRHLPLQQAIKDYAGAQHRSVLLNLLEPLSRASEKSDWARSEVESGNIYRPQAWTPGQALKFLRDVPLFEDSGLSVRIPDWWKPSSPPRPKVEVTVGDAAPKTSATNGLLNFNIELTLDGEKLTPEELEAIRTAEGLALVKGKWVEADAEKLEAVLHHWRQAQAMQFSGGISFLQAMRFLSGARIEAKDAEVLSGDVGTWSGITAGPWLQKLLEELRDPSHVEQIGSHPDLKATLRPYQRDGVSWLAFMMKLGLGACLADDMGLGKTMQILALLLHLKRTEQYEAPSLLVVPASLLLNWKAEADKFAPLLRLFIAHPSSNDAAKLDALGKGRGAVLEDIDLVITTYGMLGRIEALRKRSWRLAIIDEAQAIKNPTAAQSRTVRELKASGRIALTGTPVENHLGDLWSLFDFLNPGLLGSGPAFGRFVKALSKKDGMHYAPLRRLVKPYILRRLKTDKSIINDLPDKVEMNAWCLLTKPQAILYQRVVDQLARELAQSDEEQKMAVILGALMAFKQICNHPAQHSGDAHYDPAQSGKFTRLRELCSSIADKQEKVLLFTQFTEIIPALRELLRGIFGREGLVLTGSTPVPQRRELVEEFQREAGPPFFILSLKAGGTGLTLTAASHVIHFDRWWNPAVENQATDRAFRIGQKKNVLVHKFVCRGTLEEKIDGIIADKRQLSDGLLSDGDELSLTQMSDEELLNFVSLDVDQVAGE